MRFQVPQFIEVEDKVFGPLTVRQFIYLAGGGGLSYIVYALIPLILSLIIIPAIIVCSLLLAFYKVNDRPFIYTLESAVKFYFGNKLYIWKKGQTQKSETSVVKKQETPTQNPTQTLTENRLKDLAWSLDIKRGNGR